MNSKFIVLLFVFHAVNSDTSISSVVVKEALEEIDNEDESLKYDNTTLLSTFNQLGDLTLANKQADLKIERMDLSTHLYESLTTILNMRTSTSRQITKMLGDIEQLRYSLIKSLEKENESFDERKLKYMHIEDLFHFEVSEQLSNEYVRLLNQLQTLKFKIYDWNYDHHSRNTMSSNILPILKKFSQNEEIPEISLDDANDDEPLPEFDYEADIDELEKLQRICLMVEDGLNEMPKPQIEDQEDNVESEINAQNETQVPRWLLTEKDIEEIRSKYTKWMTMFEYSQDHRIASLKAAVRKSGNSITFFCKMLAEYFNITSIILECASKDDTECEEIMHKSLNQEHLEKFITLFNEWKT